MKKLVLFTTCILIASMTSAQTVASRSSQPKDQNSEIVGQGTPAFEKYIKSAKEEIAGNEKRFAALKAKLSDDKKRADKKSEKAIKKLEKSINILEISNNELKADLEEYLEYGEGDWTLFKMEFNQELSFVSSDLRELKVVYNDFVADNTK